MPINLSKIYTRGGDKGDTSLATGERVAKSHPRLEAYGTADELNCLIGKIRSHLMLLDPKHSLRQQLEPQFAEIQDRLFDAGTVLASTSQIANPKAPRIIESDTKQLELWIDDMNSQLSPLTSFVLPGGSLINAETHHARTVCRRLERLFKHLQDQEIEISPPLYAWINRLSDYLFVASRLMTLRLESTELVWSQRPNHP